MDYNASHSAYIQNFSKSIHPEITKSIMSWLFRNKLDLHFMAYFLSNVSIRENKRIPTAGVYISYSGMVMDYNPKFIDILEAQELEFILIHEISHLLYRHHARTVKGYHIRKYANMAMDYVINHDIEKYYGYLGYSIPDRDGVKALRIPPEYTGDMIFEPVYEWMMEDKRKQEEKKQDQQEQQDGQDQQEKQDGQDQQEKQDGQDQQDCQDGADNLDGYGSPGESDEIKNMRRMMSQKEDYVFDVHFDDDVSPEMAKEIIQKAIDQARGRGLVTSNFENFLEKIKKSKIDYTIKLKKEANDFISRTVRRSFRKLNKRGVEGVKGRLRSGEGINCIWDTSGSMSGNHETVLGTIYRQDLLINLVQIDAQEIKAVDCIKSIKEFKKLVMKGGGGTELQPAIDFIASNKKYNKLNTLILTDGWTDSLDVTGLNNVLIVTVADECPISKHKNNVRQIKLIQEN